jgi:hypothetical protein
MAKAAMRVMMGRRAAAAAASVLQSFCSTPDHKDEGRCVAIQHATEMRMARAAMDAFCTENPFNTQCTGGRILFSLGLLVIVAIIILAGCALRIYLEERGMASHKAEADARRQGWTRAQAYEAHEE